jgi:hypothetical protein
MRHPRPVACRSTPKKRTFHPVAVRSTLSLLVLGLAMAVAAPAAGGNLLVNGEFDSGLTGWTPRTSTADSQAVWAPFGYADEPRGAEGSAMVQERRTDEYNRFNDLRQCVNTAGMQDWAITAYSWGESADSLGLSGGGYGPGADAELIIFFYPNPGCTGSPVTDFRISRPFRQRWTRMDLGSDHAPLGASALILLQVVKRHPAMNAWAFFDDVYFGPLATRPPLYCRTADHSPSNFLCLRDGRFRVEAHWRRPDGSSGAGLAAPLTDDSGAFHFFDRANLELIVKVLDGCGLNQRYWVFAGGLTNVEVRLVVTDTWTNGKKTYLSPLDTTFQAFQDTSAFATCSASPPS